LRKSRRFRAGSSGSTTSLGCCSRRALTVRPGYRYYTIRQLPRLNCILALKELGLSLEQIGPLLKDRVSPAELRGMLIMKRAQVEQALRQEEVRLRHIESRIAQIDKYGGIDGYDVVTKSVGAMPFLSLRYTCNGMDEAASMVRRIAEDGAKQIRAGLRDKLIVVARNEEETDALDLEIGYSLTRASNTRVSVAGDRVLGASELPAVETMATIVRQGTNSESHAAFGAIGIWIEANNYEIAGACREVFLEPVTGPPGLEGALVEIQFPVRPAA